MPPKLDPNEIKVGTFGEMQFCQIVKQQIGHLERSGLAAFVAILANAVNVTKVCVSRTYLALSFV